MIELHTLGRLELSHGGRALDRVLAQPKRTALLVYVAAARPPGFRTRDTLCALLWPESNERRARASLRKSIHFLRRHLGADAFRARGDGLDVNRDLVWCDATAMITAIENDDRQAAVELYGGEFMAGFHVSGVPDLERWLDQERTFLRHAALDAAQRASEELTDRGNAFEAVRLARRATEIQPRDERAARRLMELLHGFGDRAGALRVFEKLAGDLRSHLGMEPSEETRALVARWRAPDATHDGEQRVAAGRTESPSPRPAEPSRPPDTEHADRRHVSTDARWRGLGIALGTAAILVALWLGRGAVTTTGTTETATTTSGRPPVLAVFPFENLLAGGDSLEWLTAGLHEQVIHELAGVPGIRVVSRTSALAHARSAQAVSEAADLLGATFVLQGSVRGNQEQLRATLHLVEAETGLEQWSGEYDVALGDGFLRAQARLGAVVAQVVGASFRPGAERSADPRLTVHPDAVRAYLQGRHLWRNLGAPPSDSASARFRLAVDIAPDFALAWASLAETWLASAHFGTPPHVAFPRADSAAIQALSRDPDLAEAHVAIADARFHYDWNWAAAERSFLEGITLNPSHPTAHWWYAGLLAALDQRAGAAAQMDRAKELDPLSPIVAAFGARVAYWGGRIDDGEALARQALQLAPGHPYALGVLGYVLLERNQFETAADVFRESLTASPKFRPGLIMALARAGHRDEARKEMARLEEEAAQRYVSPYERSFAAVGLGDLDRALGLIEEAAELRDAELVWIGVDPALGPLHGKPRFEAVLRRMGLDTP